MAHDHYYLGHDNGGDIILSTPKILYTGSVRDDPNWFNILHHHTYLEILYVVQGSGQVLLENEDQHICYQVGEGDLVILNPGIVHEERSSCQNTINLVFLAIDGLQIAGLPPNHLLLSGRSPIIGLSKYKSKIEEYFLDLIHETSGHVSFCSRMSRNLVEALLILILRVLMSDNEKESPEDIECARIKEYIDRNYTASITLESLCETVYVSKSHLSHLFKNQTGISPIKYLILKRIAEATKLLLETDLPIGEIAQRVGYEDPVYFSQIFKRTKGISPQGLRRRHQA